ncbi:hypothetical protein M422DRAFT_778966 [Sphaerobolus stellatus SS14]|uniref:Uncharacterized protein n=1 Tax=Sphaerobolus stellatus (strain SS14) TaxID=990650 RepID=A0A0C9W1P5_SPHS4|nr:hypothetical protein M422DRAFT_778966 [Sphaerobolus stellatus SS14]
MPLKSRNARFAPYPTPLHNSIQSNHPEQDGHYFVERITTPNCRLIGDDAIHLRSGLTMGDIRQSIMHLFDPIPDLAIRKTTPIGMHHVDVSYVTQFQSSYVQEEPYFINYDGGPYNYDTTVRIINRESQTDMQPYYVAPQPATNYNGTAENHPPFLRANPERRQTNNIAFNYRPILPKGYDRSKTFGSAHQASSSKQILEEQATPEAMPVGERRIVDNKGDCTYCGQHTTRPVDHFWKHVVHEFRYGTPICPEGFEPILKDASRVELAAEGNEQTQCPHCHKRYARRDSLGRHIRESCPKRSPNKIADVEAFGNHTALMRFFLESMGFQTLKRFQ